MGKEYPKIIIIGNHINLRHGGGITLFNLFKGWPKDKIFFVTHRIEDEGIDVCENYYRIGYKENRRPWPLNKFQPYYESKPLRISSNEKTASTVKKYSLKRSKYNQNLKRIAEYFLHFLGLNYFLFPLKPSDEFVKWLEDENPDLIYTQLNSPEIIFFMNELVKKVSYPLFIHMMDDWPKVVSKPGLSHLYWNPKIQNNFKFLLSKSTGLLSICQSMSDEYEARYGYSFKAFHNCIEFNSWDKFSKETYDINGKFKILYAGRIGPGTYHSILTFAKAIEKMQQPGFEIEFQIQTEYLPNAHRRTLTELKRTKINPFIKYEELPKKLASVDLLLLPMDYDRDNLNFIHLSMPTKVPEYMVTGTPILVFADKSTALFKYADKDGWAFTVSENNESALIKKMEYIMNNQKAREDISKKARQIVLQNHEANKIREEFRQYFNNRLKK